MSNNALLVFNPRMIEECVNSLNDLDIPKFWIRGYNEEDACIEANKIVMKTDYENYILIADDVIVTQFALDHVIKLLEKHTLATGYCLLSQTSPYVNLCRTPLTMVNGVSGNWEDYNFYHIDEVRQFYDDTFVSWFAGWGLTGIHRTHLISTPLEVNRHGKSQSDFEFCYRMCKKGFHFVAHKMAYIEHMKIDADESYSDRKKFDFIESGGEVIFQSG